MLTKHNINTNLNNRKVALEFTPSNLEQALKKIIKEQSEFEIIGKGIVVLPEDIGKRFKKQNIFNCKEIDIVSLFFLPREEANQIRKRHLQVTSSTNHR